jgi:hypothetical protein
VAGTSAGGAICAGEGCVEDADVKGSNDHRYRKGVFNFVGFTHELR